MKCIITSPYGRTDSNQYRFASVRVIKQKPSVNSRRYTPSKPEIFTHDWCHLRGAYVPRVWWTNSVQDAPVLNGNCKEVDSYDLHRWMHEFGAVFDWKQVTITEGQNLANDGELVIMTSPHGSSVVLPETDSFKAIGARGITIYPVQAGMVSDRHREKWWSSSRELSVWVWEEKII
jgi:hypothetical protein